MYAGGLTYSTVLDTNGFQKGINDINNKTKTGGTKMKSIIGALGISKLIGKAFDTIKNSMDSAISRLDTMNNFPKVMSNLGISASDSSKAINKLSEGLKGIPTTLDAGALAVQRFTSKNGDVQKSADIFLAVNDAILAGGASTEVQASAMEQLSQAYAKGKMDMVEWRSLQTAMPAQLKQVAKTMGLTTEELGEMMRQGDKTSETMDEFIETIIKLDKKGGNGIKSFAIQARNATDGIKTNITNMKTAVARGVANIISSLDKAMKKANLDGIGGSIKSVGQIAEKVLNNIAKGLEKINFKALINTLKVLVPVVASVVAGFVAYQTVLKAIEVINMVRSTASLISTFLSLIPAITSTKDAMLLLNMTLGANPIGLVVGGVTALLGVMVLLTKATKETNDSYYKINNTLNDYNKAMKEADNAKQEYLNKNMSEIAYYQNLANELKNITDENGKVQQGYEKRAQFIATTLNEALGTEIKITDGVVQKYGELENKIKDVIAQKRAQYLMEAQEQKYNTAKDQRNKLEEAYTEAIKRNNEAINNKTKGFEDLKKQYKLTDEQLNNILTTQDIYNNSLGLSADQIKNIKAVMEGYDNAIQQSDSYLKDSAKTYQNNEQVIADYENALGYMADSNYNAVLKMYEDTKNYIGKTDKETYNNYSVAIERQQNYLNNLKTNKDKYNEDTYNSMVSNGEAVLKELQDQQAKYGKATETGQEKVRGIWNKSLSDQLSILTGKKVEFKKTSDGHIQAYINGIKEGEPMSRKQAEKFGKSIVKEIDKAKGEANTAGSNLVYGTASGINNRSAQNSAFSAISSFGSSLLNKLKNALKEHSPSKATEEMAVNLYKGFDIGLDKEEKNVYKSIDDFGNEILDRMSNAVNVETGKMSFNGTSGSVNQILSANAQFEGTIPMKIDLDGDTIYENQQKIKARKTLQYGGAK